MDVSSARKDLQAIVDKGGISCVSEWPSVARLLRIILDERPALVRQKVCSMFGMAPDQEPSAAMLEIYDLINSGDLELMENGYREWRHMMSKSPWQT